VYSVGIGHMAAAKGLSWIMADKNFIAHTENINFGRMEAVKQYQIPGRLVLL